MMNSQSSELKVAIEAAHKAGKVALEHLRTGVTSEMKGDGTPVTVADKECERLIRETIGSAFPGDNFLGEEEGEQIESDASRKWIIDPIDGTYNYARGVPIFSTLIALENQGEIVVGVVHNPALADTYWAESGKGCFKNGEPIKVSGLANLSESQFNFGAISRILDHGYWDGFTRLIKSTYRQRGLGDYLDFALVFEGKAEFMLEAGLKPWDLAPMKLLAEEAGGRFSNLDGSSSIYKHHCLVSNGLVHEKVGRTGQQGNKKRWW
jgi:histidinol-phosphatase